VNDLAEQLVGILRGRETLPVADRHEHGLPVGREGNQAAILPALPGRAFAPDHLEVIEPCRPFAGDQLGPGDGEGRTTLTGFGIGQVDAAVRTVAGRDEHAEQARLLFVEYLRHAADLDLGAVGADQLESTGLFRHQHPAVGKEGQLPRKFERRDRSLGERLDGIGRHRTGIGRLCGRQRRGDSKHGSGKYEDAHEIPLNPQIPAVLSTARSAAI